MTAKKTSGFEEWVRQGLMLGSEVLLATAYEVAEEHGLMEPTEDEMRVTLLPEIARRVMDRWPPWKREHTQQTTMALDNYTCDGCSRAVLFASTRTTAHGRLCPGCLNILIESGPDMLPVNQV